MILFSCNTVEDTQLSGEWISTKDGRTWSFKEQVIEDSKGRIAQYVYYSKDNTITFWTDITDSTTAEIFFPNKDTLTIFNPFLGRDTFYRKNKESGVPPQEPDDQ